MAALLPLVYLRGSDLPIHFIADLESARRRDLPAFRSPTAGRPRLSAVWHLGARGRPECRWTAEHAVSAPSA
jgi:hypothetical protein